MGSQRIGHVLATKQHTHKVNNIYYLVLYKKSLQTPAIVSAPFCVLSLEEMKKVQQGTKFYFFICSVQFSSVAQSCPTLCDPMNRSTPGLPVYYQLPEFTQTHVHRVSDAIQPSHPLSSPSPPVPNPSQRQDLFQ